jgi:hypothetical protein
MDDATVQHRPRRIDSVRPSARARRREGISAQQERPRHEGHEELLHNDWIAAAAGVIIE